MKQSPVVQQMAVGKTLSQRMLDRANEMGLDWEVVADLSGVPLQNLVAFKLGRPLTSSEYELVCRALAVDSGAMYSGDASSPARSPARFRKATALEHPNPLDTRILALAAEQGRILGHLSHLVGKDIKLKRHRHIRGIEQNSEHWKEGYELGEAAREALAPGDAPLIDLPGLFDELGGHLARVGLSSESIDAASIWEQGALPVVLINENSHVTEHPGAFRASLAHELCHLLHDAGERDLTTSVSWGDKGKGNYDDALEMRARAFAPAFLAPREHVRHWYDRLSASSKQNSTRLIRLMAEYWGLSFEGAAWHAKNCALIEPEEAERLAGMPQKPLISLQQFESLGDFFPPSMFHPELPEKPAALWRGRASLLVLQALDEGHISVGRARELLTWS